MRAKFEMRDILMHKIDQRYNDLNHEPTVFRRRRRRLDSDDSSEYESDLESRSFDSSSELNS